MNTIKNHYLSCNFFLFLVAILLPMHMDAQCSYKILNPDHQCSPAIYTFERYNTSGKHITSALWDFGDGNKSTDTSIMISHTFKAGKFIVAFSCTFADNSTCGFEKMITVIGSPVPVIGEMQNTTQCYFHDNIYNSFCFNQLSTAGASKAPIVKYTWYFGDGTSFYPKITVPYV